MLNTIITNSISVLILPEDVVALLGNETTRDIGLGIGLPLLGLIILLVIILVIVVVCIRRSKVTSTYTLKGKDLTYGK